MNSLLRFVAGDTGPGNRLLVMSYMGTPMARALPFRLRIAAALASLYLRFHPGTLGGSDL